MTLPAPGLFSTITVCPSETDSLLAIMRAITSGLAPADCETMKVTGRCGQVCASACPAGSNEVTSNAANQRMGALPFAQGLSTGGMVGKREPSRSPRLPEVHGWEP